jgi:hypothetical protein
MGRRSLSLLTLLAALGAGAPAQVIPIRTVPLVQGDQYLIFPSNNLGRGGVSIALADSLLDPFRNPAFGARVGAFELFSAPTIYSSSRQTGGGRTLPLGVLGRTGAWFGALSATIQQVEASRPITPPIIFQRGGPVPLAQDVFGSADRSHGNSYVFASLGRVLTASGLSLGGSMLWSGLRALDGVDLLYPDGQGLTQSGHGVDLRLGLLKQWPRDRSLEVLVLHDRFRMTHDVTYLDLFWDPGIQQFVQSPRVEHNLDRTTTTGLHVAYQRPLSTSGWRIGWIGTANYLSHPRIARNEIVTIPRDQGHSAAYNVGLSKTRGWGPSDWTRSTAHLEHLVGRGGWADGDRARRHDPRGRPDHRQPFPLLQRGAPPGR